MSHFLLRTKKLKITHIIRNQGLGLTLRREEREDSRSIGKEGGSIIGGREGADSRIETETRGRIRRRTWKIKKRN